MTHARLIHSLVEVQDALTTARYSAQGVGGVLGDEIYKELFSLSTTINHIYDKIIEEAKNHTGG